LIEKIKTRYSCRSFANEEVKDEDLKEILECGRWAPSGLNNQPWRFIIVKNNPEIQNKLAKLTTSGNIIKSASVNIVVLLYLPKVYSKTKDILGIGACIENMLLTAHDLGYGACWLGEILNKAEKVLDLFELDPKSYELMAVISMGRPKDTRPPMKQRSRLPLNDLIIKEF